MFKLLKLKKREMMSTEFPMHNYSDIKNNTFTGEIQTETIGHLDGKMYRLMELIGGAIENWAAEYNLENLPKRIIFEQALDAMRAIEIVMNNMEN